MIKPQENPEKFERRHGPDLVCRSFSWLAIIGWVLFIIGLVIAHYARPEMDTGLVRYWDIEIRTDWRPGLTAYLRMMLWLVIISSGISLALNKMRLRRRGDHLHFNVVILLLSSLGLLLYLYLLA